MGRKVSFSRKTVVGLSPKQDMAKLYTIEHYNRQLRFRLVPGMWSRSRRLGLETVSRRTNVSSRSLLGQSTQRLGLVSVSDLCVSGLVSVSAQKVSASRLGSRTFSSRRDILCRRAVHNFSSPIQTSMP